MSGRHSAARQRMLTQPGHLYAAYSRRECWIKVGFSLNVQRRLVEINHRFKSLAPFHLIGTAAATYESERQMHRILRPYRCQAVGLSRELYLAVPSLEEIVKDAVSGRDRPPMPPEDVRLAARASIQTVYGNGLKDDIRHIYSLFANNGYLEAIE